MRRKETNTLIILSISAIAIHTGALFFVSPKNIGFWGILFSMALLITFNICVWRFEKRLIRRLSHEADLASWKTQSENAIVIVENNTRQEQKIYKAYHDIYNHMSVVSAMLNESDSEGAAEYIEKLISKMEDGQKNGAIF